MVIKTSMLINLSEILILGIIGGAVPGPMLTAAMTEVLNSNFRGSLRVIFQALFAETLLAVVILIGIYSLHLPKSFFVIISLLGAFVLVSLAKDVWDIRAVTSGEESVISFSRIILLTVLNGGFWIFWITICIPRAFDLAQILPFGQAVFLLLFECGWLLSTLGIVFLFAQFRPLLERRNLISGTFKCFAILLLLFALKSIIESISFFMGA